MPALPGAGVTWRSVAWGSHSWGRGLPGTPSQHLQGLLFLSYWPPPTPLLSSPIGAPLSHSHPWKRLKALLRGPLATIKLASNRPNCRNKKSPLSA